MKPKSFIVHAAVYGAGSILLQAASIVLLPIYTRYLSPAEFGTLDLIYRLSDILLLCLMMNGVRMATLTFYQQAKSQEERESTAATVTTFLLIVLIIAALFVLVAGDPIASILKLGDSRLLRFGVLAMLLESTTVIPLALMQARIESLRFVFATFALFISRVVLIIVFVIGFGWGVWGVLASTAISATAIGGLLTFRELVRGSFRPNLSNLEGVTKFALPFLPAGIFSFILLSADRFLLARLSNIEELGTYGLASRLATAVNLVAVIPFYKVWSAKMYQVFERVDGPFVVGRVFSAMAGAYAFVGTGVCLFRQEIFLILGSSAYAGSMDLLIPLIIGLGFYSAVSLMDATFYVYKRTGLKPWITFVAAFAVVSLNIWLIPNYGALGAAIALMIGLCIFAVTTFVVTQRIYRVRYEVLRLTAILGLAVAIVCIGNLTTFTPVGTVVKLVLLLSYPMALWATGVIPDELKAAVSHSAQVAWCKIRSDKTQVPIDTPDWG